MHREMLDDIRVRVTSTSYELVGVIMCCANYNIYRVPRKYSVKYARTPQSLAELSSWNSEIHH